MARNRRHGLHRAGGRHLAQHDRRRRGGSSRARRLVAVWNGIFAVAPDGTLYRTDGFNQDRIVKVTPDGRVSLFGIVGQAGGMTTDDRGNLYVGDAMWGHIVEFRPGGAWDIVATVENPTSVAVDPQGTIYASTGGRVVRISPANQLETIADHEQIPTDGLATDATGSLYLADGARGTVSGSAHPTVRCAC